MTQGVQSAYPLVSNTGLVIPAGTSQLISNTAAVSSGLFKTLGLDQVRGIAGNAAALSAGDIIVRFHTSNGLVAQHPFTLNGGDVIDFSVDVTGESFDLFYSETGGGTDAEITFEILAYPGV